MSFIRGLISTRIIKVLSITLLYLFIGKGLEKLGYGAYMDFLTISLLVLSIENQIDLNRISRNLD